MCFVRGGGGYLTMGFEAKTLGVFICVEVKKVGK